MYHPMVSFGYINEVKEKSFSYMAFHSEVIKFSNHMFYVVPEKVYHRRLKKIVLVKEYLISLEKLRPYLFFPYD